MTALGSGSVAFPVTYARKIVLVAFWHRGRGLLAIDGFWEVGLRDFRLAGERWSGGQCNVVLQSGGMM